MEMNKTSYISCACNRVPNSTDWGRNGLICYGACNSIAIYDPDYAGIGKVTRTLHGHKARINVVRWLRKIDWSAESEILSASTDGTAIIWTLRGNVYDHVAINDGNSLTIADGIYLRSVENHELLVCTGSTEGTFTLWHRNSSGTIEKIQTLSFGRRILTEARLSFLPRSDAPLIAIALDDCSICIYCRDASPEGTLRFVQVQTLWGHEDWIRCMDFTRDALDDLYLASGSQDASVRMWKINPEEGEEYEDETEERNESRRRVKRFSLGDTKYDVTLESILSGHEHWVYGVHWHPSTFSGSEKLASPPALLSCAMDKSMIVWEGDFTEGGVWREAARVGEVGGNSLGFYGCKYAPDGLEIMAHGYQGSFHLWRYDKNERSCVPRTGPTGHFSGIVDLCWDPKGRYLISASVDQTTRVHAPWSTEKFGQVWHEIGRPQVHGYDLSCLAMLGSYSFASGAEEKVVRVFEAPSVFQKYLSTIANTDDWSQRSTEEVSVPALGLTNKAIFDEKSDKEDNTRDLDYSRPPTEEDLIRHTLWPESQKLYGHGYEIFSMASRHDGTRLATACKSATAEHSGIIVWCTKTWSMIQKISCHRLTVTQMAFSPNDSHLISVSRDRRFCLYRCNNLNDNYELVATSSKTNPLHARIIWCCAWTHDSKYFATGSRDGNVGLWCTDPKRLESGLSVAALKITNSSITALAFAPCAYSQDSYVIAIGFDDGRIDVRKIVFASDEPEWRIYARYDTSEAHHSTVRRLAFQPYECPKSVDFGIVRLASCGMDNALKIHDLCAAGLRAL